LVALSTRVDADERDIDEFRCLFLRVPRHLDARRDSIVPDHSPANSTAWLIAEVSPWP
jgi:hypothetical protein